MTAMASQITNLTVVYSAVHSGADQRKHQSSASLAFVWGIHGWPVNSPHKWPVTRKMFPSADVIMISQTNVFSCKLIYGLASFLKSVIMDSAFIISCRYDCCGPERSEILFDVRRDEVYISAPSVCALVPSLHTLRTQMLLDNSRFF